MDYLGLWPDPAGPFLMIAGSPEGLRAQQGATKFLEALQVELRKLQLSLSAVMLHQHLLIRFTRYTYLAPKVDDGKVALEVALFSRAHRRRLEATLHIVSVALSCPRRCHRFHTKLRRLQYWKSDNISIINVVV